MLLLGHYGQSAHFEGRLITENLFKVVGFHFEWNPYAAAHSTFGFWGKSGTQMPNTSQKQKQSWENSII